MVHLSSTDYVTIFLYIIFLAVLSFYYRAKCFDHMFGEERKPNWLLLSTSLLMIEWSPMTDMMSMGIVLEDGYSGLWLLKSRFWLAGVPAILYATMWARLNFKTDNELIRLRYSGTSGICLHVFRALFLSLFVIPFIGAFIILSLRKFLNVVEINSAVSPEAIITIGVILLVLKNSFHQKIRTDMISAIVCLVAPIIICIFLIKAHDPTSVYGVLNSSFDDQIRLIPSLEGEGNSLADFIVFIFIQWWSINIVDNSDPNAQRHFQARSQFAAFKALFIPILVSSMMFLFVSTIWDYGLFEYKTYGYSGIDKEAFYLEIALKYLPDGLKAVAVIAILFSFVTTLESIINWGGGLLTVDICKKYLLRAGSDQQYKYISLMAMLIVSIISLFFAFNNEKILSLQKFIFSISAGVAPVFLLRWFWWRINAWTQISSMLSSLIYTIGFDSLYENNELFRGHIDSFCTYSGLSHYPLKIVILTVAVVATWLVVMYLTKPDDSAHLKKFVQMTGTGGFWPRSVRVTGFKLGRRLFLCLIFGITYIMPFLFIWQFKFGDRLVGVILFAVFVVMAGYVYHSMKFLLMAPMTPASPPSLGCLPQMKEVS